MSKYAKYEFKNSMYTPNPSYTYPGILTTELIQKPKINTPAITEFARVMQGIRSGQYLNLVQPLTRVLEKGTADCTPTQIARLKQDFLRSTSHGAKKSSKDF
jgi:hypothetical protein